jgi:hypothetical protein
MVELWRSGDGYVTALCKITGASNGANAVCRANSDAIEPEGGVDAIAAIAGAKRPSGAP